MDASQIAQIRGSFTNWIAANPDSASELFNNYDNINTTVNKQKMDNERIY